MSYQVEIPKTSPRAYISGRYALNLPDTTSGDWHFSSVWFSEQPEQVRLWGQGHAVDTIPILGDYGITDKKKIVEDVGLTTTQSKIYVANHFRAILDFAIAGAIKNSMSLVVGATMDYLDTEEQKQQLLERAETILLSNLLGEEQKLLIREWIQKERKPYYRGERYYV